MSRKREKPYQSSRHVPYSFSKRRRPFSHHHSADTTGDTDDSTAALLDNTNLSTVSSSSNKPQTTVAVIGVPPDCSVLDLKSRFEIYGSISRTRMDPNGLAYVTFRSHDSALSAVSAAADASFPVTIHSTQVQVMWASDPVPQWREGVAKKDGVSAAAASSKLVKAEVPQSRHGRGNKLGSAIVNPKDERHGKSDLIDNKDSHGSTDGSGQPGSFRGREIVAYDDIL